MKKLIIILLLFITNKSISFSQEASNFDYKNYLLTGIFKKQIHNQENPDYFWTWDFYIYNDMIYLNFQGDMADSIDLKPFPNGIFKLTTSKNSLIKIKTENGKILDFKLLSNNKEFVKNEKNIENNYCEQGYFYSLYNDLYSLYKTKSYFIKDDRSGIEIIDIDSNLSISFFDFSGKFIANSKEYKFKLFKDINGDSNNYIKTKNNKYILKNADSEKDVDLIIKNCVFIYFNKNLLPNLKNHSNSLI